MKIAIISTSPRQGSNSLKVAKYMAKSLANTEHRIRVANFEEIDIPMVGRSSLKASALTQFQSNLIDIWKEAELVIFVIPEYNWITSGELINALHQLGQKDFSYLFDNKVFALAGVSRGRGGRRPCTEIGTVLGKLISFLNQHSVISPLILESHETHNQLADDGTSLGNAFYEKSAQKFLDYSLTIANRWHRSE
ncbi:chromate reductase [Dyadobacter jejuensis]|uniref:Chromate reductase n=1 Tax=Dyadobacter jejuensis TaxID=1082580 RepID=A0A316ASK1_9BACT|nr:NAD(P)H-dependent oxidoreductase [Dyadobacter jejuensis]PWJ60289.1 chromate reductase [Dyadobacter jejuensis]